MPARRWWARASLALVLLSVGLLLGVTGPRSLWLLVSVAVAVVLAVAGGWWFLVQRGPMRWLALGIAVAAPLAVVLAVALDRLLWLAVAAAGLFGVAVLAARTALQPDPADWGLPVVGAPPPTHPFLVMNPRSGGGKVARFHLVEAAAALGAEVVLLDRPGTDVQKLAQEAIARGADLVGVAGGDGTQALVAQVAADHDVPFLAISAGTRNHFALDLGLDRHDPTRCLDALRDGVEARIDLGEVNDRPFVNNVSFGAYAEIVENPAYRADKVRTTLETLPDVLRGHRGAVLATEVDGRAVDGPQAILVSNNPYEDADPAGMGRRARLDRGVLGVIAIRVDSARQAVALLRRAGVGGLVRAEAAEVVVSSDRPEIPVGIDGETARLATPVHCTIRPQALRVRLPRDRPGVRPPGARLDWASLWRLAGPGPARSTSAGGGA
jgi:diacylglycerol kinase family enzyme